MTHQVAIVRCQSYEDKDVYPAIQTVFELLDLSKKITPGLAVLLKPNLIVADPQNIPSTTNPAVIGSIAKLMIKAGAKPFVGDSPAFGTARGVAKASGLAAVCQQLEVPIVELDTPVNTGIRLHGLGNIKLSQTALQAPMFINVPKLKVHSQLLFTGGVKNLYGCVAGKRKAFMHYFAKHNTEHFCEMLLKIAGLIAPELTIVDAVISMEETGPRMGKAKHTGLIIAGTNALAVDMVIAAILGIEPDKAPLLRCARKLGIQPCHTDDIKITGETIIDVRIPDFKLPAELQDISFGIKQLIFSVYKRIKAVLE